MGSIAKRFTHRRCKVLTQCELVKKGVGGGISLTKVGKDVLQVQNLGQTKFLKKTPNFTGKVSMNFRLQKSQSFSASDIIHQNR